MLFVVTKKRVMWAIFFYLVLPIVIAVGLNRIDFTNYFSNSTRSMPIGLYKKLTLDEVKVGDIVVICPKRTEAIGEAITRGYLNLTPKNTKCPFTPLLKRIAASVGDCVDISIDGVSINGQMKINSAQKKTDGNGLPMPLIKLHTCLTTGQFIALTPVQVGYDSRYLGIFNEKEILAKVTPFLTLDINYD